jgi:signal transduction histidine kinase
MSVILGVVTQAYMIHSQKLYDAQFDLSHLFKIASYICPILGFGFGTTLFYKNQENIFRELSQAKAKLEEWSKTLERRVKERTKDLTQAQEATLNIMEDLQEAYERLKKSQIQLIQAEKMEAIGRMASGVAHEVKNPLGIIVQGINYLEEELLPTQKNELEILQMLKNNIKRADDIVCALVDFSRATKLNIRPEDINSILENSIMLVQHRARLENIKIIRDLKDDLPKVLADRGKIEQVFINIFLNAIQAMPNGGKLFIRTYQKQLNEIKFRVGRRKIDGDYFEPGETAVVVEIEDTGVGISKENLAKVFDPFFTTKLHKEGTGLGLSVTKNIIDMHRGLIEIESEKGKGTKVILDLKIHKE